MGAIVLIFYMAIFVSAYKEKISSFIDYDTLLTELRDITNPWITTFDKPNEEETQEMFSMVDLIKNKTDDFFNAMRSKLEIVRKIQDYIDNIKDIFFNVTEKFTSKESKKSEQNLFSKISIAWNKVQKQLNTVIYGDGLKFDESKDIDVEKENQTPLRRWPIFIMLSSAIVCLSFSTIFHWFGALSPASSQILSRLDYAGITILIAGSCYPPIFTFSTVKCIYAQCISVLFLYSQSLYLSMLLHLTSMYQSGDVLEELCSLPRTKCGYSCCSSDPIWKSCYRLQWV